MDTKQQADQVMATFYMLRAAEGDGYEGVTHAGVAIVAGGTGRVLMAQRAMDSTDDPEVQQTWEFPGGGLNEGEHPFVGAQREYLEECCLPWVNGEVIDGWRAGDEGQYQGFVYLIRDEFDLNEFIPNDEVQAVAWVAEDEVDQVRLRPELARSMDWSLIWGRNEEDTMTETGAEALTAAVNEGMSLFDITPGPLPIHGVLCPENTPSGDKRGFNAGAVTRRAPLRLPFSHQKAAVSGHDGSVVVASIDRMMRKDGLIHFEGSLMDTAEADEFVDILRHFGKFGVSIDGDKGSFDEERSSAEGMAWFDAVRVAGATACAIPAFQEAWVALGPHPDMPDSTTEEGAALVASAMDANTLVGERAEFDRGPGWVTNPRETKRLHDYWTKKGQEGYRKINWGTNGDYRRCVTLVGEKIATNSPEDLRYIKRICAQWHHDALGYWPGDLGKPGNAPDTAENRRRAATHAGLDRDALAERLAEAHGNPDIEVPENENAAWEAVLVSSVSGNRKRPRLSYFHQHPSMVKDVWAAESGALIVEEPDEDGFKRTWGYAAEWGVCHVGMSGRCVEPPRAGSDDYPAFHLGRTKTDQGYVYTGVLTYGVGHRDADTILSESPEQAYFDNINNAWAAVRVGENERGIWFSGVVLPGVPEDHIVKIEASGQVSGEWLADEMRACLTVNVPGFPNQRPSAVYDEQGNVLVLAASAFGGVPDAPCAETIVSETDEVGLLTLAVLDRIKARGIQEQAAREQFALDKIEWED